MRERAHKIMLPREPARGPAKHRAVMEGIIIKDAEQVVTLSPDRGRPLRGEEMRDIGVRRNASVLISGRRIIRVGEYEDLIRGKSEENFELINASGKTVLPGFVDPHTHLVFAGTRADEIPLKVQGASYEEIAEMGGGIQRTVRETRAASETVLFGVARRRLDDMLSHGTTTLEAKSGYGLTTEDEIKMLNVISRLNRDHSVDIVPTFLGAHAIPEEFSGDKDGYLSLLVDEMMPTVAESGLAEFCDVFCEEGYFTPEESRRILEEGQTYGMKSRIHADEFSSGGGARIAVEVGAITADHLVRTTEDDMAKMADSGVVAVLLPAVPLMSMEERFADARRMIGLDIPVALGTDFNPNCWVQSMQTIIGLACFKLRMLPEEAIAASTINAAYAVGRGERIGSLDAGKVADLIVLDVPDYVYIPYMLDHNSVSVVIKKGEIVFRRG